MNRIVGLETEYGCLAEELMGPQAAAARVRNWVFDEHRFGLPDVHQRDWDEPAGNGGFLYNGGRVYMDMGHLEYCTPECRSLRDLVRYDRVGDRMLGLAVKELGLEGRVSFIRNNVDHYSGATFGCHENYLVRRSAPLNEQNVLALLAFLTLRVLYTGAGRIGEAPGSSQALRQAGLEAAPALFQLSQRADYIQNDLFEWVQFNRAIINTRDEPLADAARYRRLHLLHGDTSVLPETLALKVGTTALVLDLVEAGAVPAVALADAVLEYRLLSRQPDGPWIVTTREGESVSAVVLLRQFQQESARLFAGRDAETDWVLARWGAALDALEGNVEALVGRVDWVTKRWLLRQFVQQENTTWLDPWLKAQDLEFHQTDPERSLCLPLAAEDPMLEFSESEMEASLRTPPVDTRARARGEVIQRIRELGVQRYYLDWETLDAEGANTLQLLDPFESSEPEPAGWPRPRE